ncbi:hypothetical protein [Caballeronia sp. ATUFL_M2_KS44]|uniref:hypothetical protein n=1 Tax=Caballeronia sp. ATUFL_M2_KS44 TaxID=2921767 RepID=UPI0020276F62|nr:hypothetical protein [Caballeronia sp. ATUFL_M2_KS44]
MSPLLQPYCLIARSTSSVLSASKRAVMFDAPVLAGRVAGLAAAATGVGLS